MKKRDVMWLVYPGLVVGFILLSAQIIFGSQSAVWRGALANQVDLKKDVAEQAVLKAKIEKLNNYQDDVVRADLSSLVVALPINKQVLSYLTGLKKAVAESGTLLESYDFNVGEVKEASDSSSLGPNEDVKFKAQLVVGNMAQLKQFLQIIETQLPIVQIEEIRYAGLKAEILMVGKWKSLAKVSSLAGQPVPEFKTRLDEVLVKLGKYQAVPVANETGSGSANLQPGLF